MSTAATPAPSFEEAMERLESIVESMEGERLELNEMVGRYEEGVKLLAQCRQQIDHARIRVERINVLLDGSNKASLSEFDVPVEGGDESATESSLPANSGKSGARRGARSSAPAEGDEDIRLF